MNTLLKSALAFLLSCACLENAFAQSNLRLDDFAYPFPVHEFSFMSQGESYEMAYMDVPANTNEAGTIVLLHGKNFSGAYWGDTAKALADAGYHVIIPDQLGFGKSSKPRHYQFSFEQLALNTHALLEHLGITNENIFGHSMGGMLAVRYALMYPGATRNLLLVDPLGLEDWQAKGVPYVSVDFQYGKELKQTAEKLHQYEQENYYRGTWKHDYDRWVDMLDRFIRSPDYPVMAWDQALTSDMIFTQPVCREFADLKMPVLLIVGSEDRTAIGRDLATPENAQRLGHYPELARAAVAQIKNAKLVIVPGSGHLPQLEDFPHFIQPVKEFLRTHQPTMP
jgi:pimeloyl-ACP methyl ester carboxylesterase